MQCHPVSQRFRLSSNGEDVDEDSVRGTEDRGRCHRVPCRGGPNERGRSPVIGGAGSVKTFILRSDDTVVVSSQAFGNTSIQLRYMVSNIVHNGCDANREGGLAMEKLRQRAGGHGAGRHGRGMCV